MAAISIAKVTSILLASLVISACGGTLRDHQTKSSEEQDIRAVLLSYEQAWNRHEESDLAPLLDENFIIWLWIGGERKLVATKGSYVFWLRDLLIRYRYLAFGKPEIWLKEDRATVHVPMTVDARAVRGTLRLIKRGEKWFIQEFEF